MNRRAFLLGSAAALVPIPAAPVAAPQLVGAEVAAAAAAYRARVVEFVFSEFQGVFLELLQDQVIFGSAVCRWGPDGRPIRIPPDEWPRFPGSDVVVLRNVG